VDHGQFTFVLFIYGWEVEVFYYRFLAVVRSSGVESNLWNALIANTAKSGDILENSDCAGFSHGFLPV
jgi:hypothetical protein